MSQDDLLREIHGDVKLIKYQIGQLVEGDKGFDKRLTPLEKDYRFRKKLKALIVRLAGAVSVVLGIVVSITKLR